MKSTLACAMAATFMIGWEAVCMAQSRTSADSNAEVAHAEKTGRATQPAAAEKDGPLPVVIRWWGQACVSIETFSGLKIVIDPYPGNDQLGYPKLNLSANLILITHEHFDHNAFEGIQGKPAVLHGLTSSGDWDQIDHYLDRLPNQPQAKLLPRALAANPSPHSIHIRGIRTFHDLDSGAKRGKNMMFLIETDGMQILHCGDLGHVLTSEQVETTGPIDLLLIPVGGTYTIDAAGAMAVAKHLKPRWIWPIHYKTSVSKLPLATRDPFLAQARGAGMTIHEIKGNAASVTRRTPEQVPGTTRTVVIVSDFKPTRLPPEMLKQ